MRSKGNGVTGIVVGTAAVVDADHQVPGVRGPGAVAADSPPIRPDALLPRLV
jgi:hypothetical protein